MAIIKPFKALKYNPKFYKIMSDIICPPYDIVKDSEIKTYLNKNPYNVIRIELPECEGSYENVKNTFDDWKKNNVLIKDDDECIYIYEMNFKINDKVTKLTGIICLVKVDDLDKGSIIPHEITFKKAKKDRFSLIKSINCNTSPIYSLFDGKDKKNFNILKILTDKKEDISAIDEYNVNHKLWKISDREEINKLIDYFKNKDLFIADGHHRYETAIKYKNYCKAFSNKTANYTMMLLVDFFSDALVMLPTHRVLRLNDNFDVTGLKNILVKYFLIEERRDIYNIENILNKNSILGKKVIGFFYKGTTWFLLTLKKDVNLSNFSCETQLLNDLVLNKLFNNSSINKIIYTRELKEVFNLVNDNGFGCSFILPKLTKENLMSIFSRGIKLPQKTTYFYPKPITGFVMNEIDF